MMMMIMIIMITIIMIMIIMIIIMIIDHCLITINVSSPRTLERLRSLLKPLAERWAGVHLTHAATYGVR